MNGDQRYRVMFVGDRELPDKQDWAFLECDGQTWFALKRTRLTEAVLEDAWEAFREAVSETPVSV